MQIKKVPWCVCVWGMCSLFYPGSFKVLILSVSWMNETSRWSWCPLRTEPTAGHTVLLVRPQSIIPRLARHWTHSFRSYWSSPDQKPIYAHSAECLNYYLLFLLISLTYSHHSKYLFTYTPLLRIYTFFNHCEVNWYASHKRYCSANKQSTKDLMSQYIF